MMSSGGYHLKSFVMLYELSHSSIVDLRSKQEDTKWQILYLMATSAAQVFLNKKVKAAT